MKRTVLWTAAVGGLVVLVAASLYAAPRDFGLVKLVSGDKNTIIEIKLPKMKVPVTTKGTRFPVGTYIPKSYTLMKRDRSGKIWKLDCRAKLGPVSTFTVEKGKTTVLEIDPTIIVKTVRYRSSRRGGSLTIPIGLSFEGKNGQGYSSIVYMDRRLAPLPLFQIISEDKRVLANGKFEYG